MNGLTLKEIRDLFQVEYRIQCKIFKSEPVDLGDKLIALWISEAQSRILEELRATKVFIDIIVTPGVNTYTLPLDFGLDIKAELNGMPLNKVSIDELITTGDSESRGNIQAYAVYFNGDDEEWKITFAPDTLSEVRPRLWFYPEYGLYRPTIGKNQEWGTFDGSQFEGFLRIPPQYIPALMTFMMSKIFPEMQGRFEFEMKKYKQIQASQTRRGFNYKFGVR